MRERLDKILVDRGLAASRERARALILAGKVVVDDHRVDKVGVKIDSQAEVRLKGADIKYVSRGGLKLEKLESLLKRRPHEVLRNAVSGMLPKNKLGRKMIKRLKLYVGEKHGQEAQKPKEVKW